MEILAQQMLMVEPPRGMYPSRLDDKGRLKLPAAFQQYFSALREKKLYVTSLDRRTAQIYPMEVWRGNEKFLKTIATMSAWRAMSPLMPPIWAPRAKMDGQGRILFSPELRRELGIENQPVRLFAYRGRIEILTEAIYEERKREAAQTAADDVGRLEAAGLN